MNNNKKTFNSYIEKKIIKCRKEISILNHKLKKDHDYAKTTKKIKHLESKLNKLKYCINLHSNYQRKDKCYKNNDNSDFLKLDLILFSKVISMANFSHFYKNSSKNNEFDRLIKICQEMKSTDRIIPNDYNKNMSSIFSLINVIFKDDRLVHDLNLNHKSLINNGKFIENFNKIKDKPPKKDKKPRQRNKPKLVKEDKLIRVFKRDPTIPNTNFRNPKISKIQRQLSKNNSSISNDSIEKLDNINISQENQNISINKENNSIENSISNSFNSSLSNQPSFEDNNNNIDENPNPNNKNKSIKNKKKKRNRKKNFKPVDKKNQREVVNNDENKISFLEKKLSESKLISKFKKKK